MRLARDFVVKSIAAGFPASAIIENLATCYPQRRLYRRLARCCPLRGNESFRRNVPRGAIRV